MASLSWPTSVPFLAQAQAQAQVQVQVQVQVSALALALALAPSRPSLHPGFKRVERRRQPRRARAGKQIGIIGFELPIAVPLRRHSRFPFRGSSPC
jgi:hypothetical protein